MVNAFLRCNIEFSLKNLPNIFKKGGKQDETVEWPIMEILVDLKKIQPLKCKKYCCA